MRLIDIDGCKADFVGCCFLPVTNDFFGTSFVPEDVTDWDFAKCLGLSAEQVAKVWTADDLVESYKWAYSFELGREYVAEAERRGEEVVYITARGLPIPGIPGMEKYDYLQGVRKATAFWLSYTGEPLHSMIYALDKVKPSLALGVTEALEDSPTTALKLAEAGIKVTMPVWPYNAHVHHENIIRIDNWR